MVNNLDAILLLTTSDEVNSNIFFKFCDQFLKMKKNNLRMEIFINNSNYDNVLMLNYLSKITIFKSIKLHDLNMVPEEDIYIKHGQTYSGKIPKYGLMNGPNYMFLNAIKYCFYKFNTVLLLETDCILKENCFRISSSYISNISDFLISGSRYIGNLVPYDKNMLSEHNIHLNGVAFYNTGSNDFHKLVKKMENFLIISVIKTPKNPVAYDMAFTGCLINSDEQHDIIENRRILTKLINTTYIINCSPSFDKNITFEEINGIFPNHIIFHTKMNL